MLVCVYVPIFAVSIYRYFCLCVSLSVCQVDIFCLASCLFELMTLRGLPPRGMSEQDFKGMIKKGKRPKFHVNVSKNA